MIDYSDPRPSIADDMFAELAKLRAALAAERARAERLLAAIEQAPHDIICEARIRCDAHGRIDERLCDCWKRDALGEAK